MKTGLLFGSFNPIHNGHVAIAQHLLNHSDLESVWFVVSPQNPWKSDLDMPHSSVRLKMVELAIKNHEKFKGTNFEEDLPKPSFTYTSLMHLKQKYPDQHFVLIIGGDNLNLFNKWKNWKDIVAEFEVWAYPRKEKTYLMNNIGIKIFEAPLLHISSSTIRDKIKNNEDVKTLVNTEVLNFISQNKLYL
jgi:nicotinate-nucleotide adenylyltransferase